MEIKMQSLGIVKIRINRGRNREFSKRNPGFNHQMHTDYNKKIYLQRCETRPNPMSRMHFPRSSWLGYACE